MTKQMRKPADYLGQRYKMTGKKAGKNLTHTRALATEHASTHCNRILNFIIHRTPSVSMSNKTVSCIRFSFTRTQEFNKLSNNELSC